MKVRVNWSPEPQRRIAVALRRSLNLYENPDFPNFVTGIEDPRGITSCHRR